MSQIDRIILGGEELFLKAGIKSVTMDDIARHLGMSKKTIYQFFKDKNELVVALVKKKLEQDEDPDVCHYRPIGKRDRRNDQYDEVLRRNVLPHQPYRYS